MRVIGTLLLASGIVAMLGGCSTSLGDHPLPAGEQAYQAIPARAATDLTEDSNIGEPALTSDGYVVQNDGTLQVPLVGELVVEGRTPRQVSAELTTKLGARYIRDPHVAVAILEKLPTNITVEGAVAQPGIYPTGVRTTLLDALALAKGPTAVALLSDVIVFRTINGQQAGGRFNVNMIRRGQAPDPQILPGDKVEVVSSKAKATFRDVLAALPALNTFILFKSL
jgi:polysaccharide export outer membrane protein